MTYQPKFQQCPYRTSDGKCTHRYKKQKITRRKRFCGYNNPKNCIMYNEWVEGNKVDSKAISGDLNHIGELM